MKKKILAAVALDAAAVAAENKLLIKSEGFGHYLVRALVFYKRGISLKSLYRRGKGIIRNIGF